MSFFVLTDRVTNGSDPDTEFVYTEGSPLGTPASCHVCGMPIGMIPLVPPIRVELTVWGSRFGDVVFGPGHELLVTQNFWHCFSRSGLRGLIHIDRAEITRLKARSQLQDALPTYECCRVVHGTAAIDECASRLIRIPPGWQCEECRRGGVVKSLERIVLEQATWGGEDLFRARGLRGEILASERFKRFCDDMGFQNCNLIPAESYSISW